MQSLLSKKQWRDTEMTDLQAFVPNVHFEQIPIKNLVSNQDYQRNLSIKHVQKAAAHFDLYQIYLALPRLKPVAKK